MIRPTLIAALVAALLVAPARADFSACVNSLKAEAAEKGISRKTLDAAFDGLEPDLKVLDLEATQPEYTTPIWDYMAGLVDDERVADGKAAMQDQAACAGARRGKVRRRQARDRGDLGGRIRFRPRHGQAAAGAVPHDAGLRKLAGVPPTSAAS